MHADITMQNVLRTLLFFKGCRSLQCPVQNQPPRSIRGCFILPALLLTSFGQNSVSARGAASPHVLVRLRVCQGRVTNQRYCCCLALARQQSLGGPKELFGFVNATHQLNLRELYEIYSFSGILSRIRYSSLKQVKLCNARAHRRCIKWELVSYFHRVV